MDELESAYPLCRHIMPSGARCQSPALRGQPLCYFHARQRRIGSQNRSRSLSVLLPVIEDFSSIQLATNELLAAFADSRVDPKRFSLLLRGLESARKCLYAQMTFAARPPVTAVSTTEDGELLADDPETQPQTEPGSDGEAFTAPIPESVFDRLDTRDCLLTPERDNAYYMGMHKAQVTRSKMLDDLSYLEPERNPDDPLPGEPDTKTWVSWEKRQDELKKIREQREEIR